MTDAPDLLTCPFCAVYPSYEVAAFSTRHRIACEDCEFEMQKPTREEAQRAWNTRAALTVTPQDKASLIDLIGELGREVLYMLDDCETSGPVGEETHTIETNSFNKVSDILDRIDALPFEEPGVILGTGAKLQTAIKQTFLQPTMTPQEAAKVSAEDRENIVDEIESIICETHEMDVRDIDYAENIVSWLERHHPAALRAISEDSQ